MTAESAKTSKGRSSTAEVTRRRDAVERVVGRVPDTDCVRNAARVELRQAWRRGLAAGVAVAAEDMDEEERIAVAAALLVVPVEKAAALVRPSAGSSA